MTADPWPRADAALIVAAAADFATGLALVLAPALVIRLLLGAELPDDAALVARVAGVALIGLGLACWPGPPLAGMLAYSAAVALVLACLGAFGGVSGPLLWSAVAARAILSLVLSARRRPA